VFTAEFGDRGVATDHRDDAAIGIGKGRCRFSIQRGQDVGSAMFPSLLSDGGQLRQGLFGGIKSVGDIPERIDIREAGDR
jgi:hypothetical protein